MKSLMLLTILSLLATGCGRKFSEDGTYPVPGPNHPSRVKYIPTPETKPSPDEIIPPSELPPQLEPNPTPGKKPDDKLPLLPGRFRPQGHVMVFPVQGKHHYEESFNDPREGKNGKKRVHHATDIISEKMVPVVAVADGVIDWVFDKKSGQCCLMAIGHGNGWQSRYIHLNNDTPGTDDGKGNGIAPGLKEGSHVKAGQIIGWVGDSGNAEKTVPHLHFELRWYDKPINPYYSLRESEQK